MLLSEAKDSEVFAFFDEDQDPVEPFVEFVGRSSPSIVTLPYGYEPT